MREDGCRDRTADATDRLMRSVGCSDGTSDANFLAKAMCRIWLTCRSGSRTNLAMDGVWRWNGSGVEWLSKLEMARLHEQVVTSHFSRALV